MNQPLPFQKTNFVPDPIVENAFSNQPDPVSLDEEALYSYDVPARIDEGSCGIVGGKAVGYDLSATYEISDTNSRWLWSLNKVVKDLQDETGVDWLGIYKRIERNGEDAVLLKLAYRGSKSRAEFPLTEEFAEGSNNSTVGLTAAPVLIQDVEKHEGAYYKCNSKVKSEFCCPILNESGSVVGIIDAEAHSKNFFRTPIVLRIGQVCMGLGKYL